jgi:hypothetical protein
LAARFDYLDIWFTKSRDFIYLDKIDLFPHYYFFIEHYDIDHTNVGENVRKLHGRNYDDGRNERLGPRIRKAEEAG